MLHLNIRFHHLFHHFLATCSYLEREGGGKEKPKKREREREREITAKNRVYSMLLPVALNKHLVYNFLSASEFYWLLQT